MPGVRIVTDSSCDLPEARAAELGFTEALLAGLASEFRASHPEAVVLSAGMSHDLEQAVAAGATHVRVGTAVLGGRAALG